MTEPPPFLFVVGCGRSGTTVLRTVLDSHPHLAVSHEGRFIVPLGLRRNRYERLDGFDVDRLVDDMVRDPAVSGNLGLGPADVRRAIGDRPVVDFPDAVRRVYAFYAGRQGKHRYGDKMPGYVRRLPLLVELFPEARFVHIVRDGRDVALSTMAIDGNSQSAVEHAINWTTRVEAGRAAGRDLGPARYHELRYEDLLADPLPAVVRMCEFLDLDTAPVADMLRFADRPDGVPDKVKVNPRHARLAEPLSPGNRSWRRDMAAADLESFEAVAGDRLTEMGYERAVKDPPARARARALGGRLAWHVSRTRARVPGILRRRLRLA